MIRGFQAEIEKGREKLESDVTDILKTYIKRLKSKIDANFHRFDEMLLKEEEQIGELGEEHQQIHHRLMQLLNELKGEVVD